METTPNRQNAVSANLKSPRSPASPGTVASLKAHEAVAGLAELHRKWKQAVQKGSQFCNAIKNIKTNTLQTNANECPYPESVILHCKNLLLIVNIMEDIITNVNNLIGQLKSLKDYFALDDVIGQTWNFHQICSVMETTIKSYKSEIITRKYIAENIGHALSTDQLFLFASSWKNIIDVELHRETRLKMILFEFKLDE